MGYQRTGNPPGRPRKSITEPQAEPPEPIEELIPETAEPRPLSRAREGFRRAYADPAADLHSPPRFGERRRHVGKRPILHPNVIAKS